ncbi:MAG: glycoside hydrolase family 55 protein [Phycisphaerae bacterium]|nr:glycoside hydrolase family 55 protein [Phycisphaerae bacterium]
MIDVLRADLVIAMLLLCGCAATAGAREVVYPAGAGQFNVRDFGAKGDGKTDDTAAFVKAIQAVKRHFQVIYVPDGTYLVSDRIAWGNWITLQGQSRDGTIIKLKDDCPGYDGDPKGVVVTGARGPFYGRDARCNAAFSNYVRNMTIDVGRGNPGAVGVRFTTHNHGVVEDVTLRAADGSGAVGIDLSDTEFGPGMVRNIAVEGFDVGVKTPGSPSSCAFENITLKAQKVVGFENHLPVSVRGLVSHNAVPAVRNGGQLAQFVLIDGKLTGGSPDVCAIESDGSHYLRNVRTSGYKAALRAEGTVVPGASIDEAVAGRREAVFPAAEGHIGLKIKDPPATFVEPVDQWVTPDGSGEDDTRALQAAIDSGARTVFLPANVQYKISDTIVVRGAVRRILALKHHHGNLRAIDPKGNFADKPMLRVAGEGRPVTIESVSISAWPTHNDRIEIATSRPVHIKYGWFHGLTARPEATGDLFLDETGASLRLHPGQNVWIRQYNPENNPFRIEQGGRYKLPRTYVINRGANLWVLSMKTESPAVHVVTLDGGRSEILGGFFRDHFRPDQYRWFGESPVPGVQLEAVPYFITKDASLTASYVQFAGDRTRALQAIEIRRDETKQLRVKPATRAMGLYSAAPPDSP